MAMTPPPELTEVARALFDEYAPLNPRIDAPTLAIACQAFADWRAARAFLADKDGPSKGQNTWIKHDKDGKVEAVREFPQVAAARKAEALWLKIVKECRLKGA